jgi:small subunit ribosomal protein S4
MGAGRVNLDGFNMNEASCKKCRRVGQKLFLKGERCFTPKCAMVKKSYPPGIHGKKRRTVSEYGAQLAEKQKICQIYNIRERQFKRYFREASKEKGVIGNNLSKKLEIRLDNVIFRLGFAESRSNARQLVNHGHILVNNKKTNFPSFGIKPKDVIKIKKSSLNLGLFKNLKTKLKKFDVPKWLSLDKTKLEGKVISWPSQKDINIPVDIQMIVEYYSR